LQRALSPAELRVVEQALARAAEIRAELVGAFTEARGKA